MHTTLLKFRTRGLCPSTRPIELKLSAHIWYVFLYVFYNFIVLIMLSQILTTRKNSKQFHLLVNQTPNKRLLNSNLSTHELGFVDFSNTKTIISKNDYYTKYFDEYWIKQKSQFQLAKTPIMNTVKHLRKKYIKKFFLIRLASTSL